MTLLPVWTSPVAFTFGGWIADLVARGDRSYAEAMDHLWKSDPAQNPDGWREENKKAFELFKRGNDEGYIPAEDEYAGGPVPQALLDRVRETRMCAALCRKRSISSR